MLLAELSAEGWAFIITAVFVGMVSVIGALATIIVNVVGLVLGYYREQAKIAREDLIKKEVVDVKEEQKVATRLLAESSAAQEEQHKQVNSRMSELMKLVAESEHAKGVIEGQAKQKAEQATSSTDAATVVVKVEESDGTLIPPVKKLQVGDSTEVAVDGGKKVTVHEDQAGYPARE